MLTQGYIILAELNLLSSRHPSGIYVLPNPSDPLNWQGLVSVRSGYFHGGIFPFRLQLPKDFPSKSVPRIYLPKGFYHPYVDPETGELSIKSLVAQWHADRHHIWHVLHHMRNLLTSPTSCILEHSAEQLQFLSRSSIYTDNSPPQAPQPSTTTTGNGCLEPSGCSAYPNPEAADLIVNHKAEFEAKAKHCVETLSVWSETFHANSNQDSFLVDISGWKDESFLQHAREAIQSASAGSQPDTGIAASSPGYSWIDPKTLAVFSSEASTPDALDA